MKSSSAINSCFDISCTQNNYKNYSQEMNKIIQIITIFALITVIQARDCYLACDELQITYDKALCFRNCDQKFIIGATVGTFFGLCFLITFICCCRHRNYACMLLIRRKLKKKYNQVDPGLCSRQAFLRERDDFINALLKAQIINNFFFYCKNQKCMMRVENDSFVLAEEEEFLSKISFLGSDNFSKFTAEGYFLCRNGLPFVWFLKHYDPSDLAVLKGLREIVVFESSNFSTQAWSGTWQGYQHQQMEQISGKWNLIMRVTNIRSRLEPVSLESHLK